MSSLDHRETYSTTLPRRFQTPMNTNSLDGSMAKRRSAGGMPSSVDPSAIPLIEYHLVDDGNGVGPSQRPHFARWSGGGGVTTGVSMGGARPKVMMDGRRTLPHMTGGNNYSDLATVTSNNNHVGSGRVGIPSNGGMNGDDPLNMESVDYYPDTRGPRTPRVNNVNRSYIKYNSFANY